MVRQFECFLQSFSRDRRRAAHIVPRYKANTNINSPECFTCISPHPNVAVLLLGSFRAWEFIIQLQKPIKQMRPTLLRCCVTGLVSYVYTFSRGAPPQPPRSKGKILSGLCSISASRCGGAKQKRRPLHCTYRKRCYSITTSLAIQWERFNRSLHGTQSTLRNYTILS